jgi:Ca2+-binding EF-hand superfamily protein
MASIRGFPKSVPNKFSCVVTTKEIKDLHKQFKKEAPQGTVTKKDFQVVMKGMGFEDPFIADLLFAGFDQDRDGVVNFKEFITSLSTLTRGTPDEKIECAH